VGVVYGFRSHFNTRSMNQGEDRSEE